MSESEMQAELERLRAENARSRLNYNFSVIPNVDTPTQSLRSLYTRATRNEDME
jgi:hypothetical protein